MAPPAAKAVVGISKREYLIVTLSLPRLGRGLPPGKCPFGSSTAMIMNRIACIDEILRPGGHRSRSRGRWRSRNTLRGAAVGDGQAIAFPIGVLL